MHQVWAQTRMADEYFLDKSWIPQRHTKTLEAWKIGRSGGTDARMDTNGDVQLFGQRVIWLQPRIVRGQAHVLKDELAEDLYAPRENVSSERGQVG